MPPPPSCSAPSTSNNNIMFHSKEGLFFCRLNDSGEVRISKTLDGKMPDPDINPAEWAITLAENEWSSVMCSVSALGETSERWRAARLFHGLFESESAGLPLLWGKLAEAERHTEQVREQIREAFNLKAP